MAVAAVVIIGIWVWSQLTGPLDYSDLRFESGQEMASALELRTDVKCPLEQDDEAKTREYFDKVGFSYVICTDAGGTLWASDAKRMEIHNNGKNDLEPGEARLDGHNWSLTGDYALMKGVQEKIGGSMTRGK